MRINMKPDICHGKPVIKGTRIPVSQILGALSAGDSIEELLQDYPSITREDVLASLEFASYLTAFESFDYQTQAS